LCFFRCAYACFRDRPHSLSYPLLLLPPHFFDFSDFIFSIPPIFSPPGVLTRVPCAVTTGMEGMMGGMGGADGDEDDQADSDDEGGADGERPTRACRYATAYSSATADAINIDTTTTTTTTATATSATTCN
jgi:hypothetical protein